MKKEVEDKVNAALAALAAAGIGTPTKVENRPPEVLPPCGSPECGGCYEVLGGRIHPPTPSQDWLSWLARWRQDGRLQ